MTCIHVSNINIELLHTECDVGGGGVEHEVGVEHGAVCLHHHVIAEQRAVTVLGRRRGQRHAGSRAVQHQHLQIV